MKKRALSMLLVLTMVFSMIPLAAVAEEYPSIYFEEAVLIELEEDMSVWYQFVPEETKSYTLTSFDEDGVDPRCNIYDSEMNLIAEGDDDDGANFAVDMELTAGETYYFEFFEYGQNNSGQYTVSLTLMMPTDVWLDGHSLESYVGGYIQLNAGVYPETANTKLTWTSSDSTVATVDEKGMVLLVGAGEAAITVSTINGLIDTFHVYVEPSSPISLNDVKTVIYIPKEQREPAETFRFVPEESGTYRMYSYDLISDPADPRVDPRIWVYDTNDNELGYNDDGGEDVNVDIQCRLTAGQTYFFMLEPYDCEAAGQITVTLVKCVSAESISIDGGDFTANEGESRAIFTTFAPANCAQEDYVCTSSDTSVVEIVDKTAFFVGGGQATITVTSESGLTDSINVTVYGIPEAFVDTKYTLECLVEDSGDYQPYKFIPTESGVYRFQSSNIVGDWDPMISLKDSEIHLRYGKDVGDDCNFMLDYELVKGNTYYFAVSPEDEELTEDGTVDVMISKLDDSKYPVLEPNTSIEVTFDVAGNGQYFIFKPTIDGIYKIFSSKEDNNDCDPVVYIFNANWEIFGGNDDSGEEGNFLFEEELSAGETYYIKPMIYDNEIVGGYTLSNIFPCGIGFDANGGSGTMDGVAVNEGGQYTLPECSFTAPEGMVFKAWSINGVEKAVGDVVTIDAYTVATAVWENVDGDIEGDINGDGSFDMFDYLIIKTIYFDLYDPTEAESEKADVNGDGLVDAFDYLALKARIFLK